MWGVSIFLIENFLQLYLYHRKNGFQVFFYALNLNPDVESVLSYYEKTHFVKVTRITLPRYEPNEPVWQDRYDFLKFYCSSLNKDNFRYMWQVWTSRMNIEKISWHDCFYRLAPNHLTIYPLHGKILCSFTQPLVFKAHVRLRFHTDPRPWWDNCSTTKENDAIFPGIHKRKV